MENVPLQAGDKQWLEEEYPLLARQTAFELEEYEMFRSEWANLKTESLRVYNQANSKNFSNQAHMISQEIQRALAWFNILEAIYLRACQIREDVKSYFDVLHQKAEDYALLGAGPVEEIFTAYRGTSTQDGPPTSVGGHLSFQISLEELENNLKKRHEAIAEFHVACAQLRMWTDEDWQDDRDLVETRYEF
jgi:hypothetical protein